jgi:hypothetical protein
MLRCAFAIYMVLVTAAGPGLCCCSLTHLFAAHAGPRTATPDLPSCCQHSSDGEDHQGQGSCPVEKKRDDRKQPGCPCRHVEAKPAALPARAVELPDSSQAASPFFAPYAVVAFGGFLGVSGVTAWTGGPRPFLTADDLLHVHHQLRC